MPGVAVSDRTRPTSGTTVSVVDGTLAPAPRPNTVISVGEPGVRCRGSAEVVITQTGPARLEVRAAGQVYDVDVELFRAENRYVSSEPVTLMTGADSKAGSGAPGARHGTADQAVTAGGD